jgi:hypothetical protein
MDSKELQSKENTFWNWILICIAIIIVWCVFFKNTENFSSNSMTKFRSESENLDKFKPESKMNTMKIIQKIHNTSKAMGDSYYNNLYENDNSYENFTNNSDYNNENNENLDNENNENLDNNENNENLDDNNYPNLNSTKPFSSINMNLEKISKKNNTNKTANGSTNLMNQIGIDNKNNSDINCNMLGIDSSNMNDYKKKFYNMYSHQIECPAKCNLKTNGMIKNCKIDNTCKNLGKGCSNINSSSTIPDTFALNYIALDNLNKKSCVTCNFKPSTKPLNREWMDQSVLSNDILTPLYDKLSQNTRIADEARLKKSNIIDANTSNYVNFKNNVNQDSIGETAPDKINEIRTCQDANGTCKLSDYGTSIATAYDKLTNNPSYTARNNCNSYQLSGILEDVATTDMYENIKNN